VSLLCTITSMVELFTQEIESVDFHQLPPFVTFVVYKAAAEITKRMIMGTAAPEGLAQLKALRTFLGMVAQRWLGAGEYSQTTLLEF
jgi:hypothetical protein